MNKILFVTTNYQGSEDTIKNTGVNLEEFAIPYLILKATDFEIKVTSILGGLSPIDENSMSCSNPIEWDECIKILRNTEKLSTINLDEFDGVYFVGGHGCMFDFPLSEEITKTVEYFYFKNKIIAAICHGVCALINAKDKFNNHIVKNLTITSFTNKEEKIIKYSEFVPFLLETKLRFLEADFVENKPWAEHIEIDCNIITGQNNKSATLIAEKIIEKIKK